MSEARGARSDAARAEMVARQLRGRGIADERVLAAMGELPREAFIADARRDYAYVDGALPIAAGQTIEIREDASSYRRLDSSAPSGAIR